MSIHGSVDKRVLKIVQPEERRPWGDFISAIQYLKGAHRKDKDKLFSVVIGLL